MIVKRITPNKIKLGVHTDTNNVRYRFYSIPNDVVVWFNYMYQANTYYSNDVMYIDVNKSQIITNSTYDIPYIVVIGANRYNTYKLLNGELITRDTMRHNEETTDNRYLILENNNGLYQKMAHKINVIRALHTYGNAPRIEFTLNGLRNEYQELTNFNPNDGHQDRNTRPYHHRLLSEIINTTTTNTTNTTNTTTNNYVNLLASYHCGVRMGDNKYTATSETPTNTTRYFGWELETELSSTGIAEYTTRLNDLVNDGQLGKMVKFERDGSLHNGGCEIISQPMTPKYMIENRDKFKDMMDAINSMGGTSHDNGRCGLHFHVSRASLTEDAINEIYFVVETFKKELIAFSRRQAFNYCAFKDFSTGTSYGYKYIDKDYFIRNKSTGHYCCLNNANSNTLEFRFMRGTTNIRTFMASMEVIDNICNMVMNGDMKNGTTWLDIINYNDEYEDLKRYNERRNITSTKAYNNILDVTRSDR